MSTFDRDKMRLDLARVIRDIKRLTVNLWDEVTFHADDADIPGGAAMVMLGPSADPEAWNYMQISAALGRTGAHGVDDLDSDPMPPLLVLATWEEAIRGELGTPTTKRATINNAADYIASSVAWMLDDDKNGDMNFIAVDDLYTDLRRIVTRLENVLKAGIRHERTETPCEEEGCEKLLTKVYGATVRFDHYLCPTHKRALDYEDYIGIRHRHMWSERADDAWISVSDAATSIGRSQFTIRQWMKPKPSTKVPFHGRRVRSRRVGAMNSIEVYWSDVRDQDQIAIRKAKIRRAEIA